MTKRILVLLLSIGPIALAASAQTHPNKAKGFNPNSVYQFNSLDSVNAFNGNLTLSIPIGGAYPVGAGLSYQLVLHGNANVWDGEKSDCERVSVDATMAYPHRRANAGMGFTLSLGRLYASTHPTASGGWTYEAPDGADYSFGNCNTDCVTANSSFLRMKTVYDPEKMIEFPDGTKRTIEFPDGTVRTFTPPPANEGSWLLRRIANQYDGNYVTIDYAITTQEEIITTAGGVIRIPADTVTAWTIQDSHGRSHTVHFKPVRYEDGELMGELRRDDGKFDKIQIAMFVDSVELMTFDDGIDACNADAQTGKARYTFQYDSLPLSRPEWFTSWTEGGCMMENTARVTQLRSVILPDCTTFDLAYGGGAFEEAGLPSRLALPAGGSIDWEYIQYTKPKRSSEAIFLQYSWGVGTRTLRDRDARKLAIRDYRAVPDCTPELNEEISCHEVVASISDRTPGTDAELNKTERYFMADVATLDPPEYGKPFSRKYPDATGTRFLSERSYDQHGVRLRSTYVAYEDDFGGPEVQDKNARIRSTRVVHDDDGGRYIDTDNSGYDDLGHYETVTTDGTLSDLVKRVTTTDYAARTGDQWLLGVFNSITTVETKKNGGTETEKSEYCFDATGFLSRKRIYSSLTGTPSADDLVTSYTADTHGNVIREEYAKSGSANGAVCTTSGTPEYRLKHQYRYGTLEESEYLAGATSSIGFFNVRNEIDLNTGAVSKTYDTAGFVTGFSYDDLGRITAMKPSGQPWSVYEYVTEQSSRPAQVVARQFPTGRDSGTPLIESTYEFDGIGRVIRASKSLPNGKLSAVQTDYDALGRAIRVTQPLQVDAHPTSRISNDSTVTTYDALGRPLTVTSPDRSFTRFEYTGSSSMSRFASAATSLDGSSETKTTEHYDSLGRLVKVVEASGDTSAAKPRGDDVVTSYTYDVGGRLVTVNMQHGAAVQPRSFTYDGRGFLTKETHPENGETTYDDYDARGRGAARQRRQDARVLV